MTEKTEGIVKKKRVLVAMSGGVDSSVVAGLLKMQGYDVIGMHMQLWDNSLNSFKKTGGSCCSLTDANDARKVCEQLGVPFYVVNAREQFRNDVVDYFVHEYLQARTPNPCVMCNNELKFSYLIQKADELKCDFVATGHYAKIVRDVDGSESYIYKAEDETKDQSYFLFGLNQKQLSRAIMPLGDLLKASVRKLAKNFDLLNADKKDSQEICFIDNSGYKAFIEKNTRERHRPPGPIITVSGETVGRHDGLFRYTIGQKKGLGLQDPDLKDHFVVAIDRAANALIVGKEKELLNDSLVATDCNWVGAIDFSKGQRLRAKIRSRHQEADCYVTLFNNESVIVKFDEAQRAITPGQAIVFYKDQQLVGGGWIQGLLHPFIAKQQRSLSAKISG